MKIPSSKHVLELISRPRIVFAAGLVMLVISGILLGLTIKLQNDYRHDTASASAASGYPAGTEVTKGLVSMTVQKVSYTKGQGSFTAPDGMQYAIVTVAVKNRSDKPINILPSTETYIKDEKNNLHYLTPFKVEQPFRAGNAPSGETLTGQLSYLVPEKGKLNLFADSSWSGDVIKIQLR